MKNKKVIKCLLCKNKKLKKVFKLGDFFVSNFVKKEFVNKGIKCPMNLLYCKNCDLLQLSHIAPQEILYKRFYWYKSGVTETMISGLKDVYKSSLEILKLKKNDVVLDIGANDGTLLKFYKKNYITIGCEPALNLKKELKKNCHHLISNFWNYKNLSKTLKKNKLKKPKLITALGMFYDLEDPNTFIKDITNSLDDEGVFIAQLMCLKSMVKKNDLGNICHEHLEFYSLKSLKYLFETNGLEIFNIEENNVNGGSYRIYCKKLKKGSIKFTEPDTLTSIYKFYKNIKDNRRKTINFVNRQIKNKKTIFLYGASTKGNTVLQYYGLNKSKIPFASERSPHKWSKYTIGTGIKIISEEKARTLNPDFFFVTPWGFMSEFVKREKNWLKKGGKFIVPFPKMKVVSYENKK